MGQYQQWLHLREVGRHLQAQLEELVHELAQLQERADLYEQAMHPPMAETSAEAPAAVCLDNVILHALAACMNGHIMEESSAVLNAPSEIIASESEVSISSTLFAQDNQPHVETPIASVSVSPLTPAMPADTDASTTDTLQFTSYLDQPLSLIPHQETALLSEDMAPFFDQHTATDPQIELPWWLRNLSNGSNGNGPIDQESIRTNRLVQRWLERWGKQLPSPSSSVQHPGGDQS